MRINNRVKHFVQKCLDWVIKKLKIKLPNKSVTNKRILFLDDDAERWKVFVDCYPQAVWVKTASGAIKELQNKSWDEIWLDHDLGGECLVDSDREDCGMEISRAFQDGRLDCNKFKHTLFIVHSWNIVAADKMMACFDDLGCKALYIPFSTSILTK